MAPDHKDSGTATAVAVRTICSRKHIMPCSSPRKN